MVTSQYGLLFPGNTDRHLSTEDENILPHTNTVYLKTAAESLADCYFSFEQNERLKLCTLGALCVDFISFSHFSKRSVYVPWERQGLSSIPSTMLTISRPIPVAL